MLGNHHNNFLNSVIDDTGTKKIRLTGVCSSRLAIVEIDRKSNIRIFRTIKADWIQLPVESHFAVLPTLRHGVIAGGV